MSLSALAKTQVTDKASADLEKKIFFVNSEILGLQIWRGSAKCQIFQSQRVKPSVLHVFVCYLCDCVD